METTSEKGVWPNIPVKQAFGNPHKEKAHTHAWANH